MRTLLDRLGLGTRELRAWAMYDWANSSIQTTVIGVVFPLYFADVVASAFTEAQVLSLFARATTIAILIVAIVAPLLGAIADYAASKKPMLAAFAAVGIMATGSIYWLGPGEWRLALTVFVIINVGVAGSIVFYESLLPHLVPPKDLDRVSSAGYALGYLGGGVLLAINILMMIRPAAFGLAGLADAMRISLVSAGVWWMVFSFPLFRRVPEPPRQIEIDERPSGNLVVAGIRRLVETFHELRRYKQAFLLLLAFLAYNDGIQTIIRMATIYGRSIGLNQMHMAGAFLITQFVGVPCAFLFGMFAEKAGAKRAVFAGLLTYAFITLLGYFMKTSAHFYALAVMVGLVQGGTQALSRSMFASMIPKHKSSEFFSFFSVFERYAGVLGPALFAIVVDRTGTGRMAILSVLAFFVVGAAMLVFVDVEAGRKAARAAEADATPVR